MKNKLIDALERSPIIAAVRDENYFDALNSQAEVIFYLKANLLTIKDRIKKALENNKMIFVHIDLAEGIGRDKTGIEFLAALGVSGIISTRNQLITAAKDKSLLTVQRFFALDSQGLEAIKESSADFIEIMPGVIPKIIKKFSLCNQPVIAGGLIETKSEVLTALQSGAIAVSSGKKELWNA